MTLSLGDQTLLRDVLKRVSRSFYLTLAVLPQSIRFQIGLAYLLARAADTIADTGELEDGVRLECLTRLKRQLVADSPDWSVIEHIQARTTTKQSNPDERRLLEELERCVRLFQGLGPLDREYMGQVLSEIIGGMQFDIQQFPQTRNQKVHALEATHEFEYYTYAVAGCVGEFWTKMVCTHLPGFKSWDLTRMIPLGVRYGKGLQMVNILRDLPQDVRQGRCYIPRTLLDTYSLSPEDLLDKASSPSFRPLYLQLIHEARDHLDQGWRYTMATPRLEVRLRLACMWPLLIGIKTLQQLSMRHEVLDDQNPTKITRGEVYRMLAITGVTGGSRYAGTAYWGYWRKRIV